MRYASISAVAENTPYFQRMAEKYYDIYVNGIVGYENLNMTASDFKMVTAIIFGMFVGIVIAAFLSVFNKRVLGGVVDAVIADEANSPENAKTLAELGLENEPFVKYAVAKSVSLRRVLKCREEEEFCAELNKKREEYAEKKKADRKLPKFKEVEYKVRAAEDRFFIPEELKYTAEVKFDRKGATLRSAIGIAIFSAVAFVIILIALPLIFEFLNGLGAA